MVSKVSATGELLNIVEASLKFLIDTLP
uniref:Uncharacterized protein n=1 Tax=Arundo donax TaxID=35708 RepID=A0A0A9BBR6_ARUDO